MATSEVNNPRTLLPTILYGSMIALLFTLIMGVFYNKISDSNFTPKYHYYIHRGYPNAYFGTSAIDSHVPAHIIKIPFMKHQVESGAEVVKVVSIPAFGMAFFQYFVLGAIIGYVLSRFMRRKRYVQTFLVSWTLAIIIAAFFTLSRF